MLKNTAGQKIGAQIVDLDGVAFSGAVTVYVCGDAGTQAAGSVGSGACTHEGNGYHTYAPSQAETNYDLIAFTFVGTGAIPVTVQMMTVSELWTASAERTALGLAHADLDTQLSTIESYIDTEVAAIKAKTDNLPADTNTLLTSTGIKVATNADKTGYALATTPPTDAAIAAAVWTYVSRTITSGGITAQQVWEYVSTLLPGGAEAMLAGIAERLAEQVATGPVVVVPAPGVGQTTAWVMCYDETGLPEEGVLITVTATKATHDGAFDSTPVVLTSGADGLAQGAIPRGTGLSFTAQRGTNGKKVKFSGVDADTVAIPPLIGAP